MEVCAFNPESVHIHANFAININGENELFESFVYYEETESCNADNHSSPKSRVHMHEPNNDLIHVHDEGVTWTHLWENLGWTIGDSFIETRTDTFAANESSKLIFMLNGEQVQSLESRVIGDSDKLLVLYGSDTSDVVNLFDNITDSASEYNEINDPATCSGSADTGFKARLKYSLGL